MIHVILAAVTPAMIVVVWCLRKLFEKVPVAWVVDGDKEIPIAWERRRKIIGRIDRLIKEIKKAEERKEKVAAEIKITLSDLYEKFKRLEIHL
ncbi:MAG: hypothetical protein ACTSXW_01785 [Candidatus Baldrarchaeia archaeon]